EVNFSNATIRVCCVSSKRNSTA
ncbi:hypothetical protein D041_0457B, partial [Vibrio parahaemolyticus EKP-008]